MPSPLLIQDTCVLINLLASGRFAEIAHNIGYKLVVSRATVAEAMFLHDPETNEKETIVLQQHVDSGSLEILSPDNDEELRLYVAYATELDDGEAMALALAESRALSLATDDRKARSLIAREKIGIAVLSTVDILKAWQKEAGIPKSEMKIALTRITQRARFFLKPNHPDRIWWDSFFKT